MQTVFRKEIKYVLPIEKFIRIESQLDALMTRDCNGKNGTYRVRSQYYDSIGDQDLSDNISGMQEKRKIRLRIYSTEDNRVKLEYKCKSGSDGVKYSIDISKEEALLMEQHRYAFLLQRKEDLAHFLYNKLLQGAYQPKVIVEYRRTAFLYPVNDVRITFDHHIRGSVNPYGLFEENPFFFPIMSDDVGVLEVKYNGFLPSHLKNLMQQIDSLEEANSKYSSSRNIY